VGYRKQLWGVFYYLVLSVLWEVMLGHIAYGRLHVTEDVCPNVHGMSCGVISYCEVFLILVIESICIQQCIGCCKGMYSMLVVASG
jgi:hypothetical protein